MFSPGKASVSLEDIRNKLSDADLVSHYLGITSIPCVIASPLRVDKKPSFGLYSRDGYKIHWVDFATKESGGIFDLLSQMWHCSFQDVLIKISKDFFNFNASTVIKISPKKIPVHISNKDVDIQCKIREWKDYDIEYWESYGIPKKWLYYAEIYPISHKIIIKGNTRFIFGADKYAYAYVEHKEGKVTLKIYQPFNKKGFKWSNKHDKSVISLWTKIPERGDKVVICSSLKDALCLWANTGIPALAIQGEGYSMSQTAINELKRRYNKVYILLDNDKTGLADGIRLAKETGFINLVLPDQYGCKDISDLFKKLKKSKFEVVIMSLFKEEGDAFALPIGPIY